MRRTLIIVLMASFLTLTVTAQSDKVKRLTGRDWNRWGEETRLGYIVGIQDGFLTGWLETKSSGLRETYFANVNFSYGEYLSGMNTFYSDSANALIPLTFGYHYVVKKFKGASPSELEEWAAYLRKTFNN